MTVLLVDDHPLLGLGLAAGLSNLSIDATAVVPESEQALFELIDSMEQPPVLVVIDLLMPAIPDITATVRELVERSPVILLTGSEDHDSVGSCLQAGALGVLSKGEALDVILDEIQYVIEGREMRPAARVARLHDHDRRRRELERRVAPFESLTPAEQHVLRCMVEGTSAAAIAEERFVSLPTVRTQIKSVLAKLGVGSQLEAVALAHRSGFVDRADAGSSTGTTTYH